MNLDIDITYYQEDFDEIFDFLSALDNDKLKKDIYSKLENGICNFSDKITLKDNETYHYIVFTINDKTRVIFGYNKLFCEVRYKNWLKEIEGYKM